MRTVAAIQADLDRVNAAVLDIATGQNKVRLSIGGGGTTSDVTKGLGDMKSLRALRVQYTTELAQATGDYSAVRRGFTL